MTGTTAGASFATDPDFHNAQRSLQRGDWQAGLDRLQAVLKRYPNDGDLRRLAEEAEVRAHVDQDEKDDRRRLIRRTLAAWAVRLALVAAVIYAADYGWRTYAVWLGQQAAVARQTVETQAEALRLATQYADAQALLRAGRYIESETILLQLQAEAPDYPGVQALLAQVRQLNTLEQQYVAAVALVRQADWDGALPLLQQLAAVDAGYKDVALQLAEVERQILLRDLLAEAEGVFSSGDWVAAAAAYEGVRVVDPAYAREVVEDRLFTAYVRAARDALLDKEDSLEALATAEAYFRKALALRPQNREIKDERELARLYLSSQEDFTAGRWSDVITALELVLAADVNYANGSARQTLYEAYVARGDAEMASQQYEAALADFETALGLAEQDQEAVLRLFQAYLRVGDAHAAQQAYEPAVLMYRSAIAIGDLQARAAENPLMADALLKAETAVSEGNFSLAYEQYRLAMRVADSTQATITHVVQPGEYLILLATRYHSTVQAIVLANDIPNPRLIYAGQELVIPVLP